MASNAFDQFDTPENRNPFDQFDSGGRSQAGVLPQGNALDAVIEPAQAIGGNLLKSAGAGLSGIAQLAIGQGSEAAANAVTDVMEGGPSFAPETQAGQKGLETVGDLMQKGIDLVNFPISGIAGLVDLIATGDIESASKMVADVQGQGLSQTLGENTFEATGNPLAATAAMMTPDVVGTIAGTQAAKTAGKAALNALPRRSPKGLIEAGKPSRAFNGALKKYGATYDDVIDEIPRLPEGIKPEEAVNQIVKRKLRAGDTDDFLATKMLDDAGNVADDALGAEAVRQGFREGDVQMVKTSSPETKARMQEMLDIRRKVHGNERLGADMRATDVVGDSVLDRFSFIRNKADEARNELNVIARDRLEGKTIDSDSIAQNFLDELDRMDIEYDLSQGAPKISFDGSMIAKDRTSQRFIKDVADLLSEPKAPDALRAHKLKRQLDSLIDFNKKSKGGLTDAGRDIAKSVRGSLNKAIRDVDSDYARVNDTLSSSLEAMNDFERIMGSSIDIWARGANKAIGQDLRGLLSNRKSRVRLENALKAVDTTARELGGNFGDDFTTLTQFANTLDEQFGASARTSFSGDITSSVRRAARGKDGLKDAVVDYVADKIDAARDVNDQAAFRAMDDLLKR